MSDYQVKKGRYFDHDIDRIYAFLSASGCFENTIQRYFNGVFQSMVQLRANPRIGAALSAKTSIPNDYRYLVSGQYLIFYKVFDSRKLVRVYRVFHSKENYLVKLGIWRVQSSLVGMLRNVDFEPFRANGKTFILLGA